MDWLLFPREGGGGREDSHKKRRGCLSFYIGVFNCRFGLNLSVRDGKLILIFLPIQLPLRGEREEMIMYSCFEKGCRKSARDNPEGYYGWFWDHCSSKKFERMA